MSAVLKQELTEAEIITEVVRGTGSRMIVAVPADESVTVRAISRSSHCSYTMPLHLP